MKSTIEENKVLLKMRDFTRDWYSYSTSFPGHLFALGTRLIRICFVQEKFSYKKLKCLIFSKITVVLKCRHNIFSTQENLGVIRNVLWSFVQNSKINSLLSFSGSKKPVMDLLPILKYCLNFFLHKCRNFFKIYIFSKWTDPENWNELAELKNVINNWI